MASQMRKRWEHEFIRNEALACVALAIGLVVWAEKLGGGSWLWPALDGNRGWVYSTSATLSGALLGFVLTTATLVSGVISLPAFKRLRSSSQFPEVWRVFRVTLRVLAALTATALIGLLSDHDNATVHWIFYALAWLGVWASVLIVRVIWILERALVIATKGDPN